MNTFINALNINERYKIVEKTDDIDITDSTQYRTEFRKLPNILSEQQFDSMIARLGYKKNVFEKSLQLNIKNEKLINNYENFLVSSSWYKTYIDTFNYYLQQEEYDLEQGLSTYVGNFVAFIRANIEKIINNFSYVGINNEQELIDSLTQQISTKLLLVANKTLVLELNKARKLGILSGDDSESRFHNFAERGLNVENIKTLYAEYPVLARILTEITTYTIDSISEFFERYASEIESIRETFFNQKKRSLVDLKIGEGDTHQGGKSVFTLILNNGYLILYKPRNLKIVEIYNKVISEINKYDQILNLKTYIGIYRDQYAFEEFVNDDTIDKPEKITKYYQRFGQLIGLMYFLSGRDLHMENIIASGEYPVITDLEAVFQKNSIIANEKYSAASKAQSILNSSSLISGMLPNKMTHLNLDMSALSGGSDDTKLTSQKLIDAGMDTMRIVEEEVTLEKASNIPKFMNQIIYYYDYIEDIISGFERVYDLFINDSIGEVLSHSLGNEVVRVIVRNTQSYASMLDASYYPTYLKNSILRESIFLNMFNNNFPDSISVHEYKDLLNNDVPIFFNKVNDNNIYNSYMEISSKRYFYDQLYNFQDESIVSSKRKEFEKSLILTKLMKPDAAIQSARSLEISNTNNKFIETAEMIGEKLLEQSIDYSDKCSTFFTLDYDEDRIWVKPMDNSLYSGLIGVILFYVYLFKLTKNEKYKLFYQRMITEVEQTNYTDSIGIFDGSGGKLYLYYRLFVETNDHSYIEKMDTLLIEIINSIESNHNKALKNDWLGGLSSIAYLFLNIFEVRNDYEYLQSAIYIAEKIIKNIDNTHIGGFSHGYSSLALLFSRIYDITTSNRYKNIADDLIKNDNELLDSKKGWFDARQGVGTDCYPQNWCHGSVGIGMSRIKMEKYLSNNRIHIDLDISKKHLSMQQNDSLCHGNTGTADYYLMVGDNKSAIRIMDNLVSSSNIMSDLKILKVNNAEIIDSSLFTGLSGIGYELLRVANPNLVPSVLALE
ncbi:type 2 lanthipeptide synthetase LanM [Leuconostoc citreum]|uniref:type 2 lanthipeptide synthetase LanM n=1 Tax=Leuconostoc citreum TaxID=33964 RepID=UPI0015DE101D|nr:type 2 lanthipeptide synthetase LanM [Leuconostoc citreum]